MTYVISYNMSLISSPSSVPLSQQNSGGDGNCWAKRFGFALEASKFHPVLPGHTAI